MMLAQRIGHLVVNSKCLVTEGERDGKSDVVSKTVPVGNGGFLVCHIPYLAKVSLGQIGDVDQCVEKVWIVMRGTDRQKCLRAIVSQGFIRRKDFPVTDFVDVGGNHERVAVG